MHSKIVPLYGLAILIAVGCQASGTSKPVPAPLVGVGRSAPTSVSRQSVAITAGTSPAPHPIHPLHPHPSPADTASPSGTCPEPQAVENTTSAAIVSSYAELYNFLQMEFADEGSVTQTPPKMSEGQAKATVCAAVWAGWVRSSPKIQAARGAMSPQPSSVCGRENPVSVRAGQARWYFFAAGKAGFVAARDAGSPTPAMAAVSGYPETRIFSLGRYVIVELSSKNYHCASDPSLGCVAAGDLSAELLCGIDDQKEQDEREQRERCAFVGNFNTELHVVDLDKRRVTYFGPYNDQSKPEWSVLNGTLQIRSAHCVQEFHGSN